MSHNTVLDGINHPVESCVTICHINVWALTVHLCSVVWVVAVQLRSDCHYGDKLIWMTTGSNEYHLDLQTSLRCLCALMIFLFVCLDDIFV